MVVETVGPVVALATVERLPPLSRVVRKCDDVVSGWVTERLVDVPPEDVMVVTVGL